MNEGYIQSLCLPCSPEFHFIPGSGIIEALLLVGELTIGGNVSPQMQFNLSQKGQCIQVRTAFSKYKWKAHRVAIVNQQKH